MKVKIAVAQLNPIVGDLEGNFNKIISAYEEGVAGGADLVVAPECVLDGYPLEDLVLRHSFVEASESYIDRIHRAVHDSGHKAALIFGAVKFNSEHDGMNNVAIFVDPKVDFLQYAIKTELPNYGVFDEKRVFVPSSPVHGVTWRGCDIGLMICEDAWFSRVSDALAGTSFLISINGSPFEVAKNVTRLQVIKKRIQETGLPFLYVNMVGGQDELVFDGGSFLYDHAGFQQAPHFKEGVFYFDTEIHEGPRPYEHSSEARFEWTPLAAPMLSFPKVKPSGLAEVYEASVTGLRDYMRKQGFKTGLEGYSGGVDSGLVGAIGCDAVGPKNMYLVRLPSKYSSQHSLDDAEAGAIRLGAWLRTIEIEPVVEALRNSYRRQVSYQTLVPTIYNLTGTADENGQARVRGNVLMAISNQEGHLLMTTGNKSEVSVGYSTLYGDMSGGFNPIKDIYKNGYSEDTYGTDDPETIGVWNLCRWRNALTQEQLDYFGFKGRQAIVVPEEIIIKPPSAELRPDQKDEDSLPPYPVLDAILACLIERELSVKETAAKLNLDQALVQHIRQLVDNAEYKRRQAAPGIKITNKIHGRDRRYPIVNRWRG